MGSTFDFGKGTTVEETKVETNPWDGYRATQLASGLVSPNKPLYLCRSGSHLHGTNTPNSDYDFKGIYLPTEDSCLLGDAQHHFKYSTGKADVKNTSDDVDFELWSVHEWLNLMAKGDSNALSVLFSTFNHNDVLFCDVDMSEFLMGYQRLYNPNNVEGFVGFAKSQALKYGLKGLRLQVVKNILEYMETISLEGFEKLGEVDLDELMELCHTDASREKGYMNVVHENGMVFLDVLGKKYQTTLTIKRFVDSMQLEHDKYGKRAHAAMEMEGKDWKALSHSMRTLLEAMEMLSRGHVMYPLSHADLLTAIKTGQVPLEEFKQMYTELERKVDLLVAEKPQPNYHDPVSSKQMILNLYKRKETEDAEA